MIDIVSNLIFISGEIGVFNMNNLINTIINAVF